MKVCVITFVFLYILKTVKSESNGIRWCCTQNNANKSERMTKTEIKEQSKCKAHIEKREICFTLRKEYGVACCRLFFFFATAHILNGNKYVWWVSERERERDKGIEREWEESVIRRALRAQWILKSSWSDGNYENGFWSKPLMESFETAQWWYYHIMLQINVLFILTVWCLHANVCYSAIFTFAPFLAPFWRDIKHTCVYIITILNGPCELWLFLLRALSFQIIWILTFRKMKRMATVNLQYNFQRESAFISSDSTIQIERTTNTKLLIRIMAKENYNRLPFFFCLSLYRIISNENNRTRWFITVLNRCDD